MLIVHFISFYVDNFINNTQTFQINDARQLPIIIPSQDEIEEAMRFVAQAILLKKRDQEIELSIIQKQVDKYVENIYNL